MDRGHPQDCPRDWPSGGSLRGSPHRPSRGDGDRDVSMDGGDQPSPRGGLSVTGDRAAGMPNVHGFGRLQIAIPKGFSGHNQDTSCTKWVLTMCR